MKKLLPAALAVTFITGYALADNDTKTVPVEPNLARCAPYPDCVFHPELTSEPVESEQEISKQRKPDPSKP